MEGIISDILGLNRSLIKLIKKQINSSKDDSSNKSTNKSEEAISLNKSSSVSLPTTPSLIAQTSKSLDLNGCATNVTEEDGDVTDVELPPPMKIQAHTYPAVSLSNTSNRETGSRSESVSHLIDLLINDFCKI